MEGALIMAVVGYLSVTAMLMLIDCKYAILSSGGRAGGRSITMDTKVPLIPPDSSEDDDEDERHPPVPLTDLTYGDLGLYALGPGGKRLVDVAIVVSQIGFCCGYLIYLTRNLSIYIPWISERGWLVLLLPPLFCLTLLRHLNKLAFFSLFAQVSNTLALAVVFWFDFSHSEEIPFHPKEFSLKGFPFFFAVAIYCYEGAGMILSLEASVHESKRETFRNIFVCTMTGLTTLYIAFGISGYLSFGPHTQDIITLNLPHGHGSVVDFAAMVKICLGISLFFTYPMMMFPVTHLLDKTMGIHALPYKGNVLRMVLVVVTGMVVWVVPNFAILMSLIGSLCCTLLAFILPAMFHMQIFKHRLTKRQYYFDVMLIVLGILGSVIGLWDALSRMGHDQLDVNEFSQAPGKFVNSTYSYHSHPSVPRVTQNSLDIAQANLAHAQTKAQENFDKLVLSEEPQVNLSVVEDTSVVLDTKSKSSSITVKHQGSTEASISNVTSLLSVLELGVTSSGSHSTTRSPINKGNLISTLEKSDKPAVSPGDVNNNNNEEIKTFKVNKNVIDDLVNTTKDDLSKKFNSTLSKDNKENVTVHSKT